MNACTKMSDNFLSDARYSNFVLPTGGGRGGWCSELEWGGGLQFSKAIESKGLHFL